MAFIIIMMSELKKSLWNNNEISIYQFSAIEITYNLVKKKNISQ